MDQQLIALFKDCKAYLLSYQTLVKKGLKPTKKQTEYATNLKDLLPILNQALKSKQEEILIKSNPVTDFNTLYNKNFAYFDKFTTVPQRSLKHILSYQKVAKELAQFYAGIPAKTIERQGKILASKKKSVDKWLAAFNTMLQSKENQVALENRFQELLNKVNATLADKGLAAITIAPDIIISSDKSPV
jgi:hypothetical protein